MSSGRLQEVKNNKKLLCGKLKKWSWSLARGGRLWSLARGGRLREVLTIEL